jgi:Flp pilus assembly protein TadG
MMKISNSRVNNEIGATIVYVAIILGVLVMFTALAIDVNHLYAVRNELQDAADAGALAGASVLFDPDDGTLKREAAIDEGERIATANKTGNTTVTEKTVETGHWSFSSKIFTASDATEQTTWQERSFAELDLDDAFINAVRVKADRSDTPSFFAKILGFDRFFVSADAVAYIGFAGTLYPLKAVQPIAICKEAITDSSGKNYSCKYGRMFNSGTSGNTSNSVGTAGWTNFTQPCETVGGSREDRDLVCRGNPQTVESGYGIGATGGTVIPLFDTLYGCWEDTTEKNTVMNMTLPVVDCEGQNNMPNCPTVVGVVNLNVLWIEDKAVTNGNNAWQDVPTAMSGEGVTSWTCPAESEGFACWTDFVDTYDLKMSDGSTPSLPEDYEDMYQQRTIYFFPDCTDHKLTGNTGGENFGILAKIPKLVE